MGSRGRRQSGCGWPTGAGRQQPTSIPKLHSLGAEPKSVGAGSRGRMNKHGHSCQMYPQPLFSKGTIWHCPRRSASAREPFLPSKSERRQAAESAASPTAPSHRRWSFQRRRQRRLDRLNQQIAPSHFGLVACALLRSDHQAVRTHMPWLRFNQAVTIGSLIR
jgi:hypothetical protein